MINKESLIKDVTFDNRNLESVFERFGLTRDMNSSIEEVCAQKSIDPDFIVEILRVFDGKDSFPKEELMMFPVKNILAYLQSTHQFYLNKCLPQIEQSIEYFKKHFGENDKIQTLLVKLFLNYKKKLIEHVKNEEETLFPYIEGLVNRQIEDRFKNYSIKKFITQHKDVEEELREIKKIIIAYSGDAGHSMPFRIFINQLEIFEEDLSKHAMVEDEVLIPMALELEKGI